MKRRTFLRQAAMLAGAGVATALGGATHSASASGAPDALFSQAFPDVSGQKLALNQWLGKPVVVNFWATWCPPCVKEMPDLEALHQKHGNVTFLGLGIDTVSNVQAFTEKVKVSYPLLILGHGGIELMRRLGNKAGGLPFTVVFDANGQPKDKILGQVDPAKLEGSLRSLLI